jgi:hypothetical protein
MQLRLLSIRHGLMGIISSPMSTELALLLYRISLVIDTLVYPFKTSRERKMTC